jgi:pyruvoyl-dependent arginine decarboxylase (PvlArgDC)
MSLLVQAEGLTAHEIASYLSTKEAHHRISAGVENALRVNEQSVGYADSNHEAFITDVPLVNTRGVVDVVIGT